MCYTIFSIVTSSGIIDHCFKNHEVIFNVVFLFNNRGHYKLIIGSQKQKMQCRFDNVLIDGAVILTTNHYVLLKHLNWEKLIINNLSLIDTTFLEFSSTFESRRHTYLNLFKVQSRTIIHYFRRFKNFIKLILFC